MAPGVAHHVTQRGNNRQDVFFSAQDRGRYLQILSEYTRRHEVHILGWCLMTNHVHLIAIPGSAESLALALGQAHSQYSMEQNRHQGRSGHLWQGRFFSCALEPRRLLTAMRYVELNPVRAGLTAEAWNWEWSSARVHTSPQEHDKLLDWPWLRWIEDVRIGMWSYADWKEVLCAAGSTEEQDRLRRATQLGEPLGSDDFVNELEARAGRRLRVGARGRPSGEKVARACE